MEGESLSEEQESQSSRIKPNTTQVVALISPDGSTPFRVRVSQEEANQIRQGATPDRKALLQRFMSELATNYTDITVSIDGAFFDDGTFAGPDTSGFFAHVKAQIDAKRDLLNEVAIGLSNLHRSKEEVFSHVEKTAAQPDVRLDSNSTPTDFYNFYKRFYAREILEDRNAFGDDKALAVTLQPLKKAWPKLRKDQEE